MNHTPYSYLPLYVRMAIEWVDSHYHSRNHAKLVEMVHLYASTQWGSSPSDDDIAAASHHCERRFPNYVA